MNRDVEKRFRTINGAIATYCGICRENYKKYLSEIETAKNESEKYKDSEGEYKRRADAAAETARAAILNARKTLGEVLNNEADALNDEIRARLMANPAPGFFDRLHTFVDFGLTPSRAEAEALLALSFGAPLAIRALDKVLADTKSGLTVTDSGDFERDLATIRKMGREDSIFAPFDLPGCGGVWKGQPRYVPDAVGGVYQNGSKWDSTSTVIANQQFESRAKSIREMGDRWAKSFQPRIEQLDQYRDREKDGETVTAAEQFVSDLKDTANSASVETDGGAVASSIAERTMTKPDGVYHSVMQHYLREG